VAKPPALAGAGFDPLGGDDLDKVRSTPGRVVVKGKRENLSAGIHGMPSTTLLPPGPGPDTRPAAYKRQRLRRGSVLRLERGPVDP
jgi:hypothetical protein